jgi:hypothetical protein
VDHENIGSNETGRFAIRETARLDPWNRQVDIPMIRQCVGDEVRVEINFRLQLADDNTTVLVSGEAKLYEGTSCGTDDREHVLPINVNTPQDRTVSSTINLRNVNEGGDKADITFNVTNARQ